MDLLLIVFAVTIMGKRMCLPIGAATVGRVGGGAAARTWSPEVWGPLMLRPRG